MLARTRAREISAIAVRKANTDSRVVTGARGRCSRQGNEANQRREQTRRRIAQRRHRREILVQGQGAFPNCQSRNAFNGSRGLVTCRCCVMMMEKKKKKKKRYRGATHRLPIRLHFPSVSIARGMAETAARIRRSAFSQRELYS